MGAADMPGRAPAPAGCLASPGFGAGCFIPPPRMSAFCIPCFASPRFMSACFMSELFMSELFMSECLAPDCFIAGCFIAGLA